MVKFENDTQTADLFQFDDDVKMIENLPSLMESAQFDTQVKGRRGQKGIVKRRAGLLNKRLPFQVYFSGANWITNRDALLTVLEGNKFVYLNTETHDARLDGLYGPIGTLRQKVNRKFNGITVRFELIEKED